MTDIAPTSPTAEPSAKPVVLFVDDEQRILNTMRIMFRRSYQVLLADGGEQAIQLLRDNEVDVLVSDQRMPGMSGFEVLREAKRIRPQAMRILLTGYSDMDAIIGSINEGEVFRFVNKPWSNDHLQTIIGQAAEAARDITIVDKADLLNLPETEPQATPAAPIGPAEPLLVLDDDDASVAQLRELLKDRYTVHHARSIAEGMDILQKTAIGVLVVETVIDGEGVSQLLGLLKQHHPSVVAVVLTGRADADNAIRLINEGQIYRLLIKPARERVTLMTLDSATKRHKTLANNPTLNRRYKVEEKPASEVSSTLMQRISQIRHLFSNHSTTP